MLWCVGSAGGGTRDEGAGDVRESESSEDVGRDRGMIGLSLC